MLQVLSDLLGKMFDHGKYWRGRDLPKPANGRRLQHLRKFFQERHLFEREAPLRPGSEHVDHLLSSYAAGYALAATLIAEETDCVQGHVEHAGALGTSDHRARSDHGSGLGQCTPLHRQADGAGRKKSGGGSTGSEGEQAAFAGDSTAVEINDVGV